MWRYCTLKARRLLLCALIAIALPVCAQDDDEKAPPPDDPEVAAPVDETGAPINAGAIYIPLKPSFVVNYGGPGRLKYIKADISVRLQDGQAADSVRHHMPYIRNNLVMLFSAQTEESISSQEGKDALRKEALQEVREVLMNEDQQEGVVDLYFNAFLIQK